MPGRVRRSAGWVGEQAAFLVVAAIALVGLLMLLVAPSHWVRGTAVIAGAALAAAGLRLVLPETRAGLLRIRSRWLDVVVLVVLGGLILAVDIRLRASP